MVRLGSKHDRCYCIHLVARGHGKTIDHRVMEVLRKKMRLIEAVIGKRLKGEESPVEFIEETHDLNDLFAALVGDARGEEPEPTPKPTPSPVAESDDDDIDFDDLFG